jgi:hypothetical protein
VAKRDASALDGPPLRIEELKGARALHETEDDTTDGDDDRDDRDEMRRVMRDGEDRRRETHTVERTRGRPPPDLGNVLEFRNISSLKSKKLA